MEALNQLKLDDGLKVKGTDRWEGLSYIHYGHRYIAQILPAVGGISKVRQIKVFNNQDIPAELAE